MTALSAAQRRIHEAALRLFAEKGSSEVNVSELAEAAGVARGTIYNNLESTEHLFDHVAIQLADEMNQRVVASYAGIEDPARRLSVGIRLYVRRAHEEPHWGRFLTHFAFRTAALSFWREGPVVQDVLLGLDQKRYNLQRQQLQSAIGMITGTTLTAIVLVLEGQRTWRDAGAGAAELVLRALGIEPHDARALAEADLPSLAEIE